MDYEQELAIPLAIVNAISSIAGILGNITVLVVVLKNKDFQRGMNIFIACLSLVDLLICAVVQPVFIYLLFHKINKAALGVFEDNVFAILIQTSLNLLLAIAVNRLVEILNPYSYNIFATKTRLLLVIFLISVVSAIQGVLVNTESLQITEAVFQYVTISVFFLVYIKIFLIARKHRRAIQAQINSVAYNKTILASRLQRENSASTTTAIITGAFVVCYVPFSVTNLINTDKEVAKLWSTTLVTCSSAVNAYVYALRSEKFKNAVLKEIKCHYCYR